MDPVQQHVENLVAEKIAAGEFGELINKKVDDCIKRSVDKLFGYNSDFDKQIHEKITAAIGLDFSRTSLAEYSVVVADQLNALLMSEYGAVACKNYIERVKESLTPAPKEMTYDEFIDFLGRRFLDHETDASHVTITAELEAASITSSRYLKLELEEPGYNNLSNSIHKHQHQVLIHEDGELSLVSHRINPTNAFGVEGELLKMAASRTRITDIMQRNPYRDTSTVYKHDDEEEYDD